jgi:hypothetical protein
MRAQSAGSSRRRFPPSSSAQSAIPLMRHGNREAWDAGAKLAADGVPANAARGSRDEGSDDPSCAAAAPIPRDRHAHGFAGDSAGQPSHTSRKPAR